LEIEMKKETTPFLWSSPQMVEQFASSPPNPELMAFAATELKCNENNRLLDIGCGAGSNAVPLARMGWNVLGLDLSEPMLQAANRRAQEEDLIACLQFARAPMEQLPVEDCSFDFIVAHGIWNLAGSATEFRQAVREAARVARSGAALFVFTFSRNTLPLETTPVPREQFVFTEFSGAPQCFLTEVQLVEELSDAGFVQEPSTSIREYSQTANRPAIYEGIFRRI
jgi:ubiquinone/menaquinone biosynthesis C-methylase UbiE